MPKIIVELDDGRSYRVTPTAIDRVELKLEQEPLDFSEFFADPFLRRESAKMRLLLEFVVSDMTAVDLRDAVSGAVGQLPFKGLPRLPKFPPGGNGNGAG